MDLKQAQSLLSLPGGITVIDLTVEDILKQKILQRRSGV